MTGTRKQFATAALFIAGVAAGLAAAELLLRWHVESKTRVEGHFPRASIDPYPGVGYELLPCTECDPPVNSLGFRGRDAPPGKPAGVFRIAVIGDSATFGHGVSEEDGTVPGRLETLLNERIGPPGRFQVINAGVPGYNIRNLYYMFLRKVRPLEPDMVIYNMFPNDLSNNTYEAVGPQALVVKVAPSPSGNPAPWIHSRIKAWLVARSYVYRYLAYLTRLALESRPAGGGLPGYELANLQYIDEIAESCRRGGIGFVVSQEIYSRCSHYLKQGDPEGRVVWRGACAHAALTNDSARNHCGARGIPVVDLQPALLEIPLQDLVLDRLDHFTARGNRAMAEALYNFLAREWYGDKGTP